MYAQLGTTIFDGYKSFVSFSQDEEAILVEHALINRKPRLEGSGLGLRTLTISLFLHQEFCQVEQEIAKLRASKDSFEILPLLWGNGKVEGQFVIKQMTSAKVQQDGLGNTYAATVDFVLKESVVDNQQDQAQQAAQKKATSVGNKQPATKSKRVNPVPCPQKINGYISTIRSNGGAVDTTMRGYSGQQFKSAAITINCKAIVDTCDNLILETSAQSSCIFGNSGIRQNAQSVQTAAGNLGNDVANPNPVIPTAQADNTSLQAAIKLLITASSSILQNAILR